MTPAARVAAAIEVLEAWRAGDGPADATLANYLRTRRYIGAKDRAAIAERVFGALRRWGRLGWHVERAGLEPAPRARVLADLVLANGLAPDAVARLASGERHAPAPLSGPERTGLARLAGRALDDPAMPEAVRLECPPWAEPALREALGPAFAAEMAALNQPAPLDLRANALKAGREEARRRLALDGIAAEPTANSPWGLRVEGRPPLSASSAYREGLVEVQDEGSQLLARLVDARPGMQVVDFCAGAGGKSLALAATMAGKGRVVACDINPVRLEHAGKRLRRAGAHNVERKLLAHERDPWVRRHKLKFDRVLVDAPCSGTGTWRRNPDARWGRSTPDLAELVDLQSRILESAARLAKPGGRVVYGTCSLLRAEDEERIDAFLRAHPEFRRAEPDHRWTPAVHGTDGFFGAVLERLTDPQS